MSEARPVDGDQLFKVERHGIDVIPDGERHGDPRELFWIWAGANLVLTFVIIGAALIALGLTFWEGVAAIVAGNAFYLLVGLGGIPGPRAGTATMVVSRAAFGLRGNRAPTFLAWLTVVGWQAVTLVIGALALFALADEVGIKVTNGLKALLLAVLVLFTYGVAVLGHATIAFLQKIFTWALGLLMIGVAIQVIPHAKPSFSTGHLGASGAVAAFLLGLSLVAAGPMSYTNYPADYSRYLPRSASSRGIVGWTVLGGLLPSVGIGLIGLMAATATDMSDPIGGLKPLLASWYFVPFLIVTVGGSITNNFLNTYTSGLTLLALGVRLERWKTIPIDGVLATGAAIYAIFFHDFIESFTEFLSLMLIWIAPWCAVYLVDVLMRGARYQPDGLLRTRGGPYWLWRGLNREGLIAWVVGALAAFFLTNSVRWQSPLSTHVLGGADLSVIGGLLVGGGVYYALRTRAVRQESLELPEADAQAVPEPVLVKAGSE
jgi:NCS1 family nucleobase:cation symporter-1